MRHCSSCWSALPETAGFCPSCGVAVSSASEMPTALRTPATDLAATRRTGGHSPSAGAHPGRDGAAFPPGYLLAHRYRIVGLLGRGGMGEVYRADDLTLGQPVALKFLPAGVEADALALDRLRAEVRNARQVSHPHVCRVHDIAEADGRHFLTMELVDGEDLAMLLRRIGRLPDGKAVEVARQICAGFQAAHDRGVVHRDLKPANVMIDGQGRVRITDFGLAVSGAQATGEIAGTPAYMSPEQLAGEPATSQSDLYALGLVLFEVFTGTRPFQAATFAEWQRVHASEPPTSPRDHSRDLDPAVERVILRCLEKDPARRPRSAAQVSVALPGGDPLAAALAAGETPSPELVASAPTVGALSPRTAGACLAAIVALLVLLSFADQVNIHHRVPLEKSPEVLADRAGALIAELGYAAPPADRAYGFAQDNWYFGYEADPVPAPARWRRLETGQPFFLYFWFRQSPVPLAPNGDGGVPQVSLTSPSPTVEGMTSLVMDTRGRLIDFTAVPAATSDGAATTTLTPWGRLFAAAGLDQSRFSPAAPSWTPPVFADERAAWTGAFADHPDLPLRVEAAGFRGRPVFFRVVAPWDTPPARAPGGFDPSQVAAITLVVTLLVIVMAGAVVLARRNLELGRGDRTGAARLAAAVFAAAFVANFIGSDLPSTAGGTVGRLVQSVSLSLFPVALLWVGYLALEPSVRRSRPELIVSWTRLLAGEWRDPMIGRDVLFGALLGLGAGAAWHLSGWVKLWAAHPFPPNRALVPDTLNGWRHLLTLSVFSNWLFGLWFAFLVLIFLALAGRVLRSDRWAAALLWALLTAALVLTWLRSWPAAIAGVMIPAFLVLAVTRFGLVAGTVAYVFFALTFNFPLTTDFSVFYAGSTLYALGTMGALALYGFWVSRGSAPAARSTSGR